MKSRVTIKAPSDAHMRRYEVEDALHTMTRAEEIKRDANLMRDVKKLAHEKKQALSKVAGRVNSVSKKG